LLHTSDTSATDFTLVIVGKPKQHTHIQNIIIIIIIINDIYRAQTSPRSKCTKSAVTQSPLS